MIISTQHPVHIGGVLVTCCLSIEDQAILTRSHREGSLRDGLTEELLSTSRRVVGHQTPAEVGLYRIVEPIRAGHPATIGYAIGKDPDAMGPLVERGGVMTLEVNNADRGENGEATTGGHTYTCQSLPGEPEVHTHILYRISTEGDGMT